MTHHGRDVNLWEQLQLVPPPVVEISLKIGVMSADDHVQAQIEVVSGTDRTLLGMRSWPHFSQAATERKLRDIVATFEELVQAYTGPFPPSDPPLTDQ